MAWRSWLVGSFLGLAFFTSASRVNAAPFAARSQLANGKLKIDVSDTGQLLLVENRLAAETYAFDSDSFEVETDLGTLTNRGMTPIEVSKQQGRYAYRFDFGEPGGQGRGEVSAELVYTLGPADAFFRRTLKITNSAPLRLKTVRMGRTAFREPAAESVHYLTFWMAPTVEFIRYRKGGLFTGIENPFYKADLDRQGVALSFEPGLILKAGEGYESEPQFLGVYKKSGVMIEDSDRPFRYPNGSGYIPIDRNESRAMRALALDYLAPAQKTLLNINYQFFHPLPAMPHNDGDKWYFLKTIDTFADIGGDMIIFKPLYRYTKPDAARPWWNVLPEEKTATARQIADYARRRAFPTASTWAAPPMATRATPGACPSGRTGRSGRSGTPRDAAPRTTAWAATSSTSGGSMSTTTPSRNTS